MKDLLSKYDHFSGPKTRLFTRLTCNKKQEQEISANTSCRNKRCRISAWHPSLEIINESYQMGNAWVLPSIPHSTEKCNKAHCIGRTWEIGTRTFPILWLLFSHLIRSLWYTLSYGKYMCFLINFPYHGKGNKIPLMEKPGKLVPSLFP